MNIALWAIAGFLAVAFLGAGLVKLTQPKQKLAPQMGWVEDWPVAGIKTIAALEVLGAIGLILPAVLDIAPVLVPIAATGLAITMVGAIVVHLRRGEWQNVGMNTVLLVLAVVVAIGRFGAWAF